MELVTVATAAAAALVAEMVKESWPSVRAVVARLFQRGGETEKERQLSRLDADRSRVNQLDEVELRNRWQRRFIALVEDFPETFDELAVLANWGSHERSGSVAQSATGNNGPVIQIGGENSGNISVEGSP